MRSLVLGFLILNFAFLIGCQSQPFASTQQSASSPKRDIATSSGDNIETYKVTRLVPSVYSANHVFIVETGNYFLVDNSMALISLSCLNASWPQGGPNLYAYIYDSEEGDTEVLKLHIQPLLLKNFSTEKDCDDFIKGLKTGNGKTYIQPFQITRTKLTAGELKFLK